MSKWRSIDYEKLLESEIELIKNSKIGKGNKERIFQYMDFRLTNGVSLPRVCREIKCLRLLCERYPFSLENID
ncbi:MAG: hypothetical protein QXU31_06665, partial [Archaeoglobaceae archaeon]